MLRVDQDQLQYASAAAKLESEPPSLQQLLEAWEHAKTQELTANAKRVSIEQQLLPLVSAPEEGEKSMRVGVFKVTRTNKLNYRGDLEAALVLAHELELAVSLTKVVLDETALKRLRKTDRTSFDLLVDAGAVTTSPAKPGFSVARVATAETTFQCLSETVAAS